MPRGQYDRAEARARREALVAGGGAGVAPSDLPAVMDPDPLPLPVVQSHPSRVRLLDAFGFIDEIGAVYGPKPAGYETDRPAEVVALVTRGARLEIVL